MPITINGDDPEKPGEKTKEEEEKAKPHQASPKDGPSDFEPEVSPPQALPQTEEGSESGPLETLPLPEDCTLPEQPDDDYKVGFCRPPKKNQFQKGVSGNPRGRPKSSKNLSTLVDEAFHEKVRVKIGSKYTNRPVMEVALRQLAAQAAKGDKKAIELALKLLGQYMPDIAGSDDPALSSDEIATFDALVELQKRLHQKPDDEEDPEPGAASDGGHNGGNDKGGDVAAPDDDGEDDD